MVREQKIYYASSLSRVTYPSQMSLFCQTADEFGVCFLNINRREWTITTELTLIPSGASKLDKYRVA